MATPESREAAEIAGEKAEGRETRQGAHRRGRTESPFGEFAPTTFSSRHARLRFLDARRLPGECYQGILLGVRGQEILSG